MSSNPFRFGRPLGAARLIGREGERQELARGIRDHRNLSLVGSRGMGKTSLLAAVISDLRVGNDIYPVYVDAFPAVNTRRFAEIYASALTMEPSQSIESMQQAVKNLVPSFLPRVTITGSGKPGLQLDLWDRDRDIQRLMNNLFDAPVQVAEERGRQVLVVLDDFEDLLAVAEDSLLLNLSQAVRKQKSVNYLFVLRRESTAKRVFTEASSPFYRLSEPVLLDPVPDQAMVLGLEERFREIGREVEVDLLFRIVELADRSPHYIQMLAHAFYEEIRDDRGADEAALRDALVHVIEAGAYGFKSTWDQLSPHQRNLVLAVAQGYRERLHSQRMVFELGLGSPSTVSKNLKTLSEREVLQRRDDQVHFVDPFFGAWLQRRMT
jgi:uncharacterized protein